MCRHRPSRSCQRAHFQARQLRSPHQADYSCAADVWLTIAALPLQEIQRFVRRGAANEPQLRKYVSLLSMTPKVSMSKQGYVL